jgi:hypothetical protein
MTRERLALVPLVALALLAAATGCGTPSPDLFVVERTGSVPGARLTLLVSDGSVRCNGGEPRPLGSAALLEARDIARELPAAPPTTGGEAQLFAFTVRHAGGTLRFPDTAARPTVLPRLARFTRGVAQDVCALER